MRTLILLFTLLFSGVSVAGTATVTWVAPDQREDNTSLLPGEIAGFKIYYGTAPGDYMNSIHINDPAATGYTLTELDDNATYYMVVTTADTDGRESMYSLEVDVVTDGVIVIAAPKTVQEFILQQGLVN